MVERSCFECYSKIPSNLNDAIKSLTPQSHLCLIYETRKEWVDAIIPYVIEGLRRNEKCIYIVDVHKAEVIKKLLINEGINIEMLEEKKQLLILHESQAYTKEGYFDPDRMINLLISETETAISEGYEALRVTGEMTWMLKGNPGSERLLEYEAKLNSEVFQHYPCLALCQYDRFKFDPGIIKGVMLTHPLIIWGNQIYKNFYYTPPDEYLEKNTAALDVERWLDNLKREKHIIDELEESKQKYYNIFENALEGIFRTTLDGKILIANKFLVNLLGYDSFEDFMECIKDVGKDLYVNPEDRKKYINILKENKGYAKNFEVQFKRKDGTRIWVLLNARIVQDKSNNMEYIEGSCVDITEKVQALKLLKESEERYRTLVENSYDGIGVVQNGIYIYVNKRLFEMFGYESPNDLLGKSIAENIHPDDQERIIDLYNARQTSGNVVSNYGFKGIKKNGDEIYLSVSASNIKYNEVDAILEILRDITEEKKTERLLLNSIKEKETLLREINHRVKNNLQLISSILSIQGSKIKDHEASEKLNECINRIKTISLLQNKLYYLEKVTNIFFKDYIDEIFNLNYQTYQYYFKNDVKFENHIPEDFSCNMNDAISLGLLVNEMINNSLKHAFKYDFSHQNKRKTIKIKLKTNKINDKERAVKLKISDNGTGIPFDIDVKNPKTIGLQLIKDLVEQIEGDIKLIRKNGTTFEIDFNLLY